MKGKINKSAISALKPGETLRDTDCKGFLVQVAKSGVASYKIQTDLWVGPRGRRTLVRTIRHTFGTDGEMAPDEARVIARGLLARVQAGEDITRPPVAVETATEAPASAAPAVWTVDKAYQEYCRTADERTARDMRYRLEQYLSGWRTKSIADISEHEVRARHVELQAIGAHTANRSLRDFRAVYNLFLRVFARSNPPPNPVLALDAKSWAKEKEKHQEINLNDPAAMRDWYARLRKLSSTLRQEMHLLGLLSGLRPSNLVAIEKAWLRLDANRIVFPADVVKTRSQHIIPLSAPMAEAVRKALAISNVLYPESAWLFPTRNQKHEICATSVWRERGLKNPTTNVQECGYALRHTFASVALMTPGVAYRDREFLMGRQLENAGAGASYDHLEQLFEHLLEKQSLISAEIVKRIGIPKPETK